MLFRFLKFFPALALALWLFPAHAQDLYTVTGVHVDASAASSSEAADLAIEQGRPKAWQVLYRRLTREEDWGRQPALDPATLVRVSQGYVPMNERRSTTRYVADVTYEFNPDAVARVLREANIPFTQVAAHRILLVPMSPAYNSDGLWAQAFTAPSLHDPLVPFSLPQAADAAPLGQLDFDNASWNDVAQAAQHVNASEAALVEVTYAGGKMTVNIRRLGADEDPAKTSLDVPLVQTPSATYPSAAQAAVNAIDDLWKARTAINGNAKGLLIADVRLDSLGQWGQIQTALASVENVTGVQMVDMDMGYARLQIAYQGTPQQLRDSMSGQGLSLSGRPGAWMISLAPTKPDGP